MTGLCPNDAFEIATAEPGIGHKAGAPGPGSPDSSDFINSGGLDV